MAGDETSLSAMDLLCPLHGVLVGAGAEVGEEAKFKMIVGVDESGKQQVSLQVEGQMRRRDFLTRRSVP